MSFGAFPFGSVPFAGALGLAVSSQVLADWEDDAGVGDPVLVAGPPGSVGRSWGPLAYTPLPGQPGGSPAVIGADGGLASPLLVLPESAVQLIEPDGTHVSWLPHAEKWTWRRGKTDPGSGIVTINRHDPDAAELRAPRQLRFFDRGNLRHRSLILPEGASTISQPEEGGESKTVDGPGALALFNRWALDPIREDLQPIQDASNYSFAHVDYNDVGTGWSQAVDVAQLVRATDWPPGPAVNIWGPSGTPGFAPGASCYFRDPAAGFTNPTEQVLAYIFQVNNVGRLKLNGDDIIVLPNLDDHSNYLETHQVRLTTSAGVHHLAGSAFNRGASVPGPLGTRASFRAAVFTLDAHGQLDVCLGYTSPLWKAYEFPQSRPPTLQRPGWTAGGILEDWLNRWEIEAAITIGRTFDEFTDTAGQPWRNIFQFAAAIGGRGMSLSQQLAEAHCDIDWSPGSDVMHAWIKDTRGTVRGGPLPSGYDDQIDGCIVRASHDSEPPLATRILLRWQGGWVKVTDAAAELIWGMIKLQVDIPLCETEETAIETGEILLTAFAFERVQTAMRIEPRIDAQRPGLGFDVADYLPAPNRGDVVELQVVQSYTHTAEDSGHIWWDVEAGDLIADRRERIANWLAAVSAGTIGGRTLVTTPYRAAILPPTTPMYREPILYDHNIDDDVGLSKPWTVDDYGTLQSIFIDLPAAGGGTWVVTLNGSVIHTLVVPAGVTQFVEAPLDTKVLPDDYFNIDSAEPVAYVVTLRVA